MANPLAASRYISLTTFRRDGSAVATPVWVVSDDGERLLIWTGASTGKAKRIAGDPRVLVAPCGFRGAVTRTPVEARARLLEASALPAVVRLLRGKYGVQFRALELQARLGRMWGRSPAPMTVVEVRWREEGTSRPGEPSALTV